MSGEACADCRYWDSNDVDPDELSEGSCRRYPPCVPIFGTDDGPLKNAWLETLKHMPLLDHPMTYGGEWCGEWKPRKEAYEQ